MTNPYTPGSKEYDLLQNLINLVDHIDDYVHHCENIDCSVVREMVENAEKDHQNIIKGS